MDWNSIICGDCAKVLTGFPANYIDLTVTSPPYDNLREYNGYTFDFEPIAQQLYRVTKPGGVVVWVVGDATIDGSETCTSDIQKLFFRSLGFNVHDTMIFNRQTRPLTHRRYEQEFEFMLVFSKGSPKTFNPLTQRNKRPGQKGFDGAHRLKSGEIERRHNGDVRNRRIKGNVWSYSLCDFNANSNEKFVHQHPAIFPEALARDHIISWSNPGDLILDPMCGSGTTLKMAKELGRNYIGIDISEEYCNLSQRRVEGAKVPLFVMPPEPNGKPQPEQLELIA